MNWSQKTTPLRQLNSAAEQEIANLELSLLDPVVRKSDRLAELLAEDFVEFGSSGHMFSREQVLESIKSEPEASRSVDDMQVKMLAMNIALVTYRAHYNQQPTAESLRSSVWVHRGGRWQMTFHQGTLCPTAK
jgi:hypothetical protein